MVFALAALSIPVIIHLWNIRPGKTLKVGSISLITEASKSTKRSFKLLDILLLIIRCLLLSRS
jgi:UDP-N-acetylglucosamine:LPS N-acetylglucosamine transferase